MLNLSNKTLKFHNAIIFFVQLQTLSHSICMLMIYLCTKFQMPATNGSLLIAIKLKAKYVSHSCNAAVLHSMKKNYLNKR